MRIPSARIIPGTTIVWDAQRIAVRAVEPDVEPGFVWVTNSLDRPRHARIGVAETVLLEAS
jgi:hypothetical protein